MTREDSEAIIRRLEAMYGEAKDNETKEALFYAIEALKEMSAEEYRQRLMEVFHQTDHDELITFVVQPKEKEFKSLEYILQKQPFEPRPHGEWKNERFSESHALYFGKCSQCGKTGVTGNFCSVCGSDNRKMGEAE